MMRLNSPKSYLILLLFNFRASCQMADIYDILVDDKYEQRREGDQFVVGLYKELPEHAVSKGTNTVSMKNRYGAEFTCIVPIPDEDNKAEQETEAESRTGGDEPVTIEKVEVDEKPDELLIADDSVEEPVVLDKLTWFLQNYQGSCLKYDGGFWKTKVCFKPVPHIIQWHDQTTFDLGKLSGVFDPENPDHKRLRTVAKTRKKKKRPFLQLAFTGGTDGRVSLVNIGCAEDTDRVKKLAEPIQLVYVFDLLTKLACDYEDISRSKKVKNSQLSESSVSKGSTASVGKILDETFSKLTEKGLKKKSCLYYTPGWFTFEICYKKQIQQYHIESKPSVGNPNRLNQRVTQQFSLGDWDGKPLNIVKGSTPGNTYAETFFVEGTKCDLTSRPRKSTVRFKCNKNIKNARVELFQEVQTCVYIFVVGTRSLCDHKEFKTKPLKTKEIICYLTESPPDIAKAQNQDTFEDSSDKDSMI